MNKLPEIESVLDEIHLVKGKHNITSSQLAKKSGISLSTMSKLEHKKYKPTYELLCKVYNTLYDIVLETVKAKKVSDIMVKDVETVTMMTPISEASKKMKEKGFSQLPLLNRDGELKGMVTERSLLDHPDAQVCGDAVDYNYAIVEPDTDKESVLQLAKNTQAVIVMKDGKIVGIATKADFI